MQSSRKGNAGRLLIGIVVLGALAAVAVGAAVYTVASGASQAWSDAASAASETAADADALASEELPPDDENAWALLRTLPPGALGSGTERLPTLQSGAPPGPEELAEADAIAASLSISAETASVLDAALARPHLMVDCTFDLAGACPQVLVLRALNDAALLALRDAGHGDAVAGITRMSHALRLARDRIGSARTMLELTIATRGVGGLIDGAALVAARVQARREDATGPAIASAWTAMGEEVDALIAHDWSPDRALVGEALAVRSMVERVTRGRGGRDRQVSREPATWLTVAYYDEVRAYARDPEHVPPPPLPDLRPWGVVLDPLELTATLIDQAPMVDLVRTSHTEAAREASIAARSIESARAQALRIP